MTELDDSLALHPDGPGQWNVHTDPRREAGSGMFGGWTAAVLLKSVLDEATASASAADGAAAASTPSALTVHYIKQVPPGCDATLRTRTYGGGRSLGFWQTELSLAGLDGPAAVATIVLAKRRDSDTFTDLAMPDAPDPETLEVFHPPGLFGERSMVRPVLGHPAFDQPDTRSVAWVRETSGRPLDYLQLAYLSDNLAPRIFFKSPAPRPYSTITLSVYFHASEADMDALGDDYIMIEGNGSRAAGSTVGSHARLWSRKGILLATTEQLGWFK